VFTLTMPNAVAAYYRFGDLCLYNTNSFALFPKSVGRDLAMIFMSLHEMVAFGLFAGPLFHMWEKLIHIHHKPFAFRAAMRIPLCALMVFLAVAFPFFGAINAMLGAFTTSFGTYIIPAFAFNMAFKSDEGMIKQPYFNFKVMRIINWITVALVMILGVGYGGYASIKNFINQFSEYEVFAECYQCNKYGKLQTPDKFDELSEEGRFL
jgi:auxin influx carrier (AUX1 LAX family)